MQVTPNKLGDNARCETEKSSVRIPQMRELEPGPLERVTDVFNQDTRYSFDVLLIFKSPLNSCYGPPPPGNLK